VGRMVPVHDRDLPLSDIRGPTEQLGNAVTYRLDLVCTAAHGFFVLPRAGGDAPSGVAVDHHRQSDEAVNLVEGWQNLIADVGDARVNRRRIALNRCGTRVHGPPPMVGGGTPAAPPVRLTLLRSTAERNGRQAPSGLWH
jgi:hypothetical protein